MEAEIRPLEAGTDAVGCDAVIRSLPYFFADRDGIRKSAEEVRAQRGLVAHERGQIVGFATLEPSSSQAMEITWLAIRQEWRGSGLGRRLVEQIAAEAANEGLTLLCALTVAASEPELGVQD